MQIAMKFAFKYLLIFALGMPTGTHLGQAKAWAECLAGNERQSRLAVDGEKAETRPTLREQLQQAARSFAEQVAGKDDARFVQVFEQVYRLAEESALLVGRGPRAPESMSTLPEGLSLEEAIRRREASKASFDSILNDATCVENYRKLLEQGGTPRIVGEVETDPDEICVEVGSGAAWCCTGTLVAPNVVLTSGHCQANCASLGLNTAAADPSRVVKVQKAIRHEGYRTTSADLNENDLTVLILKVDVEGVDPRKIATGKAIDTVAWCRLVGFWTTDLFSSVGYGRQRKADVLIASRSCNDAATGRYGGFAEHEIVAGGGRKDSCGGDSGRPLYIQFEGRWNWLGRRREQRRSSERAAGGAAKAVSMSNWTCTRTVSGRPLWPMAAIGPCNPIGLEFVGLLTRARSRQEGLPRSLALSHSSKSGNLPADSPGFVTGSPKDLFEEPRTGAVACPRHERRHP